MRRSSAPGEALALGTLLLTLTDTGVEGDSVPILDFLIPDRGVMLPLISGVAG
jgi:hypothetical protein